jgi:hypothetical protein
MKILTVIACHSNCDLKKEALKHNLKYLKEISSKIVIVGSSEFPLNVSEYNEDDFKLEILYFPNDQNLCYKKYFGWYICQNLNLLFKNYSDIILTNDSFIITRSLLDFKNLFLPNIEMTGILASGQTAYHFPDFLRRYNKNGLQKIMSIFQKNLYNNSVFNLIINCEINSMCDFTVFQTNLLYDYSKYKSNIHFDNELIKQTLNENYPIIKIKKIRSNYYFSKDLPDDFDAFIYKSLNNDLPFINESEIKNHFLNNGIKEGRIYKENQKTVLCNELSNYIENNQHLHWLKKFFCS